MEKYDSSWNLIKSERVNLPEDEKAYDRIYKEWQKRSWESWLNDKLVFPFLVKRMEDDDDAYFKDVADYEPLDLVMK